MDMNEWIDVSTILADLIIILVIVSNSVELNEMNVNVENLIISSNSCNELKSLNLNEYQYLKSVEIGDDCFENVDLFKIDELNELKSIKIGNNSFTLVKSGNIWDWDFEKANNTNRSFSVLNCDELESIEIGSNSFSDYGGGFELRNLPKLSTIKIGDIRSHSPNFHWSSFVIKGIIDMILLMNRSSTFEFYWIRKWCTLPFFNYSDIKYLNDLNE